jgi:hypothetical protein
LQYVSVGVQNLLDPALGACNSPSAVQLKRWEPSIVLEEHSFVEDLPVGVDGFCLPVRIGMAQCLKINGSEGDDVFVKE